MESKYAHLQKPTPPPRRASRKCIVLLLVYNALLVTATVTMIAVFNRDKFWTSFHTVDTTSDEPDFEEVHHESSSSSGMKMYDMSVGDMKELVGIDTKEQVEMVTMDYFGTEVVTFLDFKKSLGTFYVASWGECYMIGGLDSRFLTPEDLIHALDDTKDNQMSESDQVVIYEKAADHPITDKSLIPEALKGHCKDRPAYWLRQVNMRTVTPHRYKRGLLRKSPEAVSANSVRVCVEICINIGRRGAQ